MKRILALTTINNTIALKEAIKKIRNEYGNIVEIRKIYFDEYENPDIPLDSIEEEINNSTIILVDIRGDVRVGRELTRLLKDKEKTIVVLVGGSQHIFAMTRMGSFRGDMIFKPEREKEFNIHAFIKAKKFSSMTKVLGRILPFGRIKDMRRWVIAQEYYAEGDSDNLKNLILFLLKNYADVKEIKKVPPPKHQPPYGFYIPKEGICEDIEEYKRKINFDKEKPTVGVLLYGGMHFDDTKPLADMIYDYLKNEINFLFLFALVEYNIEAINKYFKNIDLFLNFQYFRIHGGPYGGEPEPTYQFFKELDVPYIIGLRAFETEIKNWKESKEGINPLEIVLGVILPELDGGIEPIFLAGLERLEDSILGIVKQNKVLQDRIEKIGNRIKNWLRLRNKPNSKKRIAIITYNYPPGEENLASAGYLDVFESLRIFLEKLKERGYDVSIPEISIKNLFLSSGIVNSPNYLQKSGLKLPIEKYLSEFKALPESVQKEVMKHWGKPPGKIMTIQNDILIPGIILGNVFLGIQPARGAHEDLDKSYHDKDLPPHHQYLAFYNYLEKVFRADVILHFGMHGTLEFTKGKEIALSNECFPDILIGDIPNLYYYWIGNTSESTIAKRRSYALCISHASPPMKSSGLYENYIVLDDLLNQYEENKDKKTLELVEETARELNLPLNPLEMRKELFKMKRRLIPFGLHVMDRKLEGDSLIDYLLSVLRIEREFSSIFKLLANRKGLDVDKIKNTRIADELELEAKEIIKKILGGAQISWLPKGFISNVNNIVDRIRSSSESENLLRALEGKYIFPARGGDPIRDPDVYPSGRAMFAFDPRLIPTIVADLRGKKAADLLIETYLEKNHKYPETIGIVLWGFETMKTGGDTIATIFSLLGVKIKHKKSLYFKELEIIPLDELKRPRIDVVITICGIFRDTLGTHIELLNRALQMVANLDESLDKNYIRKHYIEMKGELKDFALARIFGPSPTEYATSMRTMVENSSWNEEEDLVRNYEDSMNYAYFNGRIEKNENVFSTILKSVDIVAQERDNTEYEVTDLDHYYEFLGGLSRTVQDKKGEKAEILVIDSTEEDVVVEDLKNVIERATRTRTLNPLWIEGMLKHDFHGAKKIKDRMEYLLAFAATTGKVENWLFDQVADKLIFDEEMRKKLQLNNPYATIKISELLMESEKRGYWKISEEKLKKLRETILNMEGDIEE
ncbi:MAG: magnesium chelatase subunit H [Candidatus Helarchaeota archaeon]